MNMKRKILERKVFLGQRMMIENCMINIMMTDSNMRRSHMLENNFGRKNILKWNNGKIYFGRINILMRKNMWRKIFLRIAYI